MFKKLTVVSAISHQMFLCGVVQKGYPLTNGGFLGVAMPLTSAERVKRHREKLKQDVDKFKEHKKKHAAIVKAKTKKISELSEAEKEKQREKWRTQKHKQKKAKKSSTNEKDQTTEKTDTGCKKNKQKKLTAMAKKLKKALRRIQILKTSLQTTKKRLYRLNKANKKYQELLNKMKAREEVLEISLRQSYKQCKTQNQQRALKSLAENENVVCARKKTYVTKLLGLKGNLRKRKIISRNDKISVELQSFFLRDDVSRCTAGKRECRTEKGSKKKEQIRYLTDTVANLHKLYKSEGGNYSLSTFYRHKPFFVIAPGIQNRDTCLCVKHANFEMLLLALHKNKLLQDAKATAKDVLSELTCDLKSDPCMNGECEVCKINKLNYLLAEDQAKLETEWMQWERTDHEYKKTEKGIDKSVVTKKTTKVFKKGTVAALIKCFENSVPKFKAHYFTWKHQQKQYQECINSLKKNEALILCDFSENYSCKWSTEIQSTHFGASKQQITLHTGMVYWEDGCQSFCSVADNNCHEPAAIWAHLIPVIKMIRRMKPETKIIHFFSDGPSSQYRQKKNFFLHNFFSSKLKLDYSTWSFSESGHGKGVADGIGGSVKRALDRHVTYGNDITSGLQAHATLTKIMKSVECFYIQDSDIENIKKVIPKDLSVITGTMKIHQIISTSKEVIRHRNHSCFCGLEKGLCDCFSPEYHNFGNKTFKSNDTTVRQAKILSTHTTPLKAAGHSKKTTPEIQTFKPDIQTFNPDTSNLTMIVCKADIHSTNTRPSKMYDHSKNTTPDIQTFKHGTSNLDTVEIFDEEFDSTLKIKEHFDDSLNSTSHVSPDDDNNAMLGVKFRPSPEIEFVDSFDKNVEFGEDIDVLSNCDYTVLNFVLQDNENIFPFDCHTLNEEPRDELQHDDLEISHEIRSNRKRILSKQDKYPTEPKRICKTRHDALISKTVSKENDQPRSLKGLKTAVTRTLPCATCKAHVSPFKAVMSKCMACKKSVCSKCSHGYTYFDYICSNCLGE